MTEPTTAPAASLLPPGALTGVRLAFSASGSPDLERLGLTETHVRLAMGEITRAVLVAGGSLAYGGYLKPDGYTQFLFGELKRYAEPKGDPLKVYLAWTEHRKETLKTLQAAIQTLGKHGRVHFLTEAGEDIADITAGRGEAPPDPDPDPELAQRCLTAMRRRMARETTGRVLIGGKRDNFQGAIPGLMEEALLCLDRADPQPVFLAGGFGGATAYLLAVLGAADMSWFPTTEPDDPRWRKGMKQLREFRDSPRWKGLANGLTPSENQRLATTHRPSEIADLVVLGLGRR